MNFASSLRGELSTLAEKYAQSRGLPNCLSYGEMPAVCFTPYDDGTRHGNFMPESYRAIISCPAWRQRLGKVHTLGRRSLPATERGRWMELDSCNSSDALLMNVFCHPRVLRSENAFALLDIDRGAIPFFGVRAKVPLANGGTDRTEVDMRIGNLLVEAKLTETDFQRVDKAVLRKYRDFFDVFEEELLPQTEGHYLSYQLLRNVLAAHALQCSFCVLLDARRPDLVEAWYAVIRCVKPVGLRTALRILTWQELAQALPAKLQAFLGDKYGIKFQCFKVAMFQGRKGAGERVLETLKP